jgi:hypothetical protein
LPYTALMKRHLYGFVCGLVLVVAGCADEERRPSSDLCTEGHQCELGYCIDGHCLDPLGDEDLDDLLNEIEVMLGTDPFDPDTDQDGEPDGEEISEFVDPSDGDGDGLYDAVESNLIDEDCDGLSNQADAAFSELACDDELPCTDDLCDPTKGCIHTLIEGACDGGNPCTENETCAGGVCQGGNLKNLVESGNGETYTGWQNQSGSWGTNYSAHCDEAPESISGCCFLTVGNICEGSANGKKVSQIDQKLMVGGFFTPDSAPQVELRTMIGAVYGETTAVVLLQPQDASGAALGEPLRYEVQQSPWVELIETAPIPAETESILLSLRAEREQTGPLAAVFDDLHVSVLGCAD